MIWQRILSLLLRCLFEATSLPLLFVSERLRHKLWHRPDSYILSQCCHIYKRPVFVTVLVPCSNHSAILDLQPLTNACLNVCWGFRVCGQKSLICLIFGENVVLPAQRLQGNFAPGHILKRVLQLYALSCLLAEQQHRCTVRINMSKHISECAFVLKVKTNSESIAESA